MAVVWSSCSSLFPLVVVIVSVKQLRSVHQTETVSIVLIIKCSSLLFCDSAKSERLQLFYKQGAGDIEGLLYLGEPCRVLLTSNFMSNVMF